MSELRTLLSLPVTSSARFCETGDFLGQQRSLAVAAGDLLAVKSAGAYGFAMSSNYNSRPRPPEVLIAGDQSYLIRARETMDDVWRGETLVPKG